MKLYLLLVLLIYSSLSFAGDVTRHQINPWEADIGYSAVVEANNQLHISGVACSGNSMKNAVIDCYAEIQTILARFKVSKDNIVKETIYTTDIEALKNSIPERKRFYHEKFPAATWVQVSRLYNSEHLLEIELLVQLPSIKNAKYK